MSTELVIVLGCVGGLLPDVIRLIKTRHEAELPAYLKRIQFFVGLVLLVALGGAAAALLGAGDVKQALAYGYGAPELVSRILAAPAGGGETVRGEAVAGGGAAEGMGGLRSWWSK